MKQTRPLVIKLFPCSTELSMEFIMLINVKMPTTVGILAFFSILEFERIKISLLFSIMVFYEQLKFHAQLSLARKSFTTLRPIHEILVL